jgi:sugar O-acyltransferase (sialic acid O-acetyltransferase NeuD family)
MSGPLVLGSGGHAKVVISTWMRANGASIEAILDADPRRHGARLAGLPIIGGDEILKQYSADSTPLLNGIGAVGASGPRSRAFTEASALGFRFATLIDPSAVLAGEVNIAEGAQIFAGAVVQIGVRVGRNAILNSRVSIDHDCEICDHAHVASGAVLAGDVRIGTGSFVGAGATIIQGIDVGDHAVIGAGAVVVQNVPAGALVVGVPGRVVRRVEPRT